MNVSKYQQYDNDIIKLYKSGVSCRTIAAEFGMKENCVTYRLKINGVSKRSISEALVGRPKSEEHRHALSVNRIKKGVAKGSRNPNWKGGIQDNWSELKNSSDYKAWRMAVYTRDGFICRACKQEGLRLEAHHILQRSQFPELTLSVDNGITLCISCHRKAHSKRVFRQTQRIAGNSHRKVGDNPQPSPQSEGRFNDYALRAKAKI